MAEEAVDGSPVTLFAAVEIYFHEVFPESKCFLCNGEIQRVMHRSPGPVKSEISERVIVASNAAVRAEQQAEMLVEVAGTAEIECGKSVVAIRFPALPKQFAAERELRAEIALQQPAQWF